MYGYVLSVSVRAAISPNEVVVVYNNHPYWNTGARQSKAVADYYCAARGIPTSSEVGASWYTMGDEETISPVDFNNCISTPLRAFLSSRAGLPSGTAPDLASDPTKAIVLCYGIPLGIRGNERAGSVDAALTLLFNTSPWGQEPIGSYQSKSANEGSFGVNNPYCTDYSDGIDPNNRTKATDFGWFRQSDDNHWDQDPPSFTIVRMLDDSHALAGGEKGVLYRGVRTGNSWTWTDVSDRDKYFVCHRVNDISVLDSQHAWVCTEGGTLLQTNDGGQTWSALRSAWTDYVVNDPVIGASFYSQQDGWIIGKDGTWHGDTQTTTWQAYIRRSNTGNTSHWGDLPTSFVPKSIAGVSANEAWVSGDSGIYHTTDGGATWGTPQYNGNTGDIWVRNNVGWAIGPNGSILHTTDGTNWTVPQGSPTLPSGTADLAVYDATHLAIACAGQMWLYDGNSWTTDNPGRCQKLDRPRYQCKCSRKVCTCQCQGGA